MINIQFTTRYCKVEKVLRLSDGRSTCGGKSPFECDITSTLSPKYEHTLTPLYGDEIVTLNTVSLGYDFREYGRILYQCRHKYENYNYIIHKY
jgi:hypothetical protein